MLSMEIEEVLKKKVRMERRAVDKSPFHHRNFHQEQHPPTTRRKNKKKKKDVTSDFLEIYG